MSHLTRLRDWPERLDALLRSRASVPFEWGRNDCCTFVADAIEAMTGRGDVLSISEDGTTCTVTATAEATAVDLLRGSAMTYGDGDQQSLYPGDLAFEYVVDQAGKPVVWPAKEYFQK